MYQFNWRPVFDNFDLLLKGLGLGLGIAVLSLAVGSLIGLGLGPLLVGLLSDALLPAQGKESLRLALLIVVPLYLWSAAHYYAASLTLAADLGARGPHSP